MKNLEKYITLAKQNPKVATAIVVGLVLFIWIT